MSRILIADDERKIRDTIYDYLTHKGFEVMLARNGEEAVQLAAENPFDLIVLDVMMPEMNGIEACHSIRRDSDVPVLFLSALGEESDMLAGFDAGADDYLVKPFPLSALQRKCEVMIRRASGANRDDTLTAGGLTLNLSRMTVSADGAELPVTGKDYELLLLLIRSRGQVVSRNRILTKLWGFDFEGDARVVDTHIKRLRRALGDRADCIKTRVGVGYYFAAD